MESVSKLKRREIAYNDLFDLMRIEAPRLRPVLKHEYLPIVQKLIRGVGLTESPRLARKLRKLERKQVAHRTDKCWKPTPAFLVLLKTCLSEMEAD